MTNISEPQPVPLSTLIEREGLTEVVVVNVSPAMYQWSAVGVYAKDGRFFLLDDAGCSCNWYGDGDYTLADLSEATREQAIEAVRRISALDEEPLDDATQRDIAKVRDFR